MASTQKAIARSLDHLREAVYATDLGKRQSASVVYVYPVVEKADLRRMLRQDPSGNKNTPPLKLGETVDVWATVDETKRIVRQIHRETEKKDGALGQYENPRFKVVPISSERTRVRRIQ